MNLLKKLIISIVIIMIILGSILPSSSYAALTPEQQAQMEKFVRGYVEDYGDGGRKAESSYNMKKGRTNIYIYDYTLGVNPTKSPTIESDCSSFISFIYNQVSPDGKLIQAGSAYDTLAFKEDAVNGGKKDIFEVVPQGAELQVGDVLFKDYGDHRHVMIYIGNNQYAHSSGSDAVHGVGSNGVCIGTIKSGTYDMVFRIKDKKKYVVKMSKYFSRKYDYDNMINFVNDINRNSSEPGSFFIQKYIDFWIEDIDEKNNKSTANNKNMYIVTDYCINGNLKEYISNIKKYYSIKLNYSFYWDIIFQMIIPINFLHKLGYIHFDIKPTNYLVMNNNQLLLNDFCLSIKEENIGRISTDELEGDSIYISPELFYKDVGIITHKNDIFSLGLSILELLTEIELPKNGSIWQKMRNHEIPKEFLEKIPLIDNDNENRNKFIELIIEMTQINSNLRPELDLLLNDENKFPELYNRYQMLKNNYRSRQAIPRLNLVKKN